MEVTKRKLEKSLKKATKDGYGTVTELQGNNWGTLRREQLFRHFGESAGKKLCQVVARLKKITKI